MKPLGKAMKIAHYEHQNKETVLNQLLTSYQDTPHIATDQTLGNLLPNVQQRPKEVTITWRF